MQSVNEIFVVSSNLNILHEHCRDALKEEDSERLYDLLHHYQQIIRDEINRCLGTSTSIRSFSPTNDNIYSVTYTYFKKEIFWHVLELSIFLSLAKDTIVPKDDNFLYPVELVFMFVNLLEQSAFKQCVLSDVMLARAVQRRETTSNHIDKFNRLLEKTTIKWRFTTNYFRDLDREQTLIGTEYESKFHSTLQAYLAQQAESLPIIDTRVITSPTVSYAENKLHDSPQLSSQEIKIADIQNSALTSYEQGDVPVDYFAESSTLSEECNEEMLIWLILLSSEALFQRKNTSVLSDSVTELSVQQFEHVTARLNKLLCFFADRNNQLECEIESRLADVEGHTSSVSNAVEKLFSFTEDARKWTIQLMTEPEKCESRPVCFEFDSSLALSPVYEREEAGRSIVLVPEKAVLGYSQPLSIFRIADKAYEEPPIQKIKRFQEKFRQLFQDCQAERTYLKELLYVKCNQRDGLERCEQTDKEQRENLRRTKDEFELSIKEWQVWQQTMFGFLADLGKEVLEACEVAINPTVSEGADAKQEYRK